MSDDRWLTKNGDKEIDPAPTPILQPHVAGTAGVILLLFAWFFVFPFFVTPVKKTNVADPSIHVFGPEDLPGALKPANVELALQKPYTFDTLKLPESDKEKLREQLKLGTVKLASITLWDNVDEDGDAVRISGAGFTQIVSILHKPNVFFVPYFPGSSINIEGIRDGTGGITLGVSTSLGDQLLPVLAPGDTITVSVP